MSALVKFLITQLLRTYKNIFLYRGTVQVCLLMSKVKIHIMFQQKKKRLVNSIFYCYDAQQIKQS